MTPPGVWTSEAPAESGYYWFGNAKLNGVRVGGFTARVPLRLHMSEFRSTRPIPSAERLAAMERAVEALAEIAKDWWSHAEGCKFKFVPVDECPNPKCGARAMARAALAAVEAAK